MYVLLKVFSCGIQVRVWIVRSITQRKIVCRPCKQIKQAKIDNKTSQKFANREAAKEPLGDLVCSHPMTRSCVNISDSLHHVLGPLGSFLVFKVRQ